MARQPHSKKGQALLEYTLILALITIGTLAVMTAMGVSVRDFFSFTSNELDTAIP
jgi:Flp pilus assembly pilin Flp